jgi:hypothetical protein
VAGNHKIADPVGKTPLLGKLDDYQQDKYARIQDGETDNPGQDWLFHSIVEYPMEA